jgi:hypothetical protein
MQYLQQLLKDLINNRKIKIKIMFYNQNLKNMMSRNKDSTFKIIQIIKKKQILKKMIKFK